MTFVLSRGGRVIFTVTQVSPQCFGVGHFSVVAHRGKNRFRFVGRVHGRKLAPGTYKLVVRTRSGRVIRRVTLVVVKGAAPSASQLQAMRTANTCPVTSGLTSASATGGDSSTPVAQAAGPSVPLPRGVNAHSGVLGSNIAETARAIRPVLIVLLGLSILLLGMASLPREAVPDPRMHDLLVRHRLKLAGLGTAALVAVVLAFVLG